MRMADKKINMTKLLLPVAHFVVGRTSIVLSHHVEMLQTSGLPTEKGNNLKFMISLVRMLEKNGKISLSLFW